jgi:precorrin-3B methylase
MIQNLTTDQRRQIAALNTIPGYKLLLDFVVSLNRDQALERLKLAREREAVTEAAYDFRSWDTVVSMLRDGPKQIEQELKDEGDPIYG